MQQDHFTSQMRINWHKIGYRVIDCSTDEQLALQVQFIGTDGKALPDIGGTPLSMPNKPENELRFARIRMLWQVMCRFLNAGGTYHELCAMSDHFLFNNARVDFPSDYKPHGIDVENFFEILYKKSDDEYRRVVEDQFWEDLDGFTLLQCATGTGIGCSGFPLEDLGASSTS